MTLSYATAKKLKDAGFPENSMYEERRNSWVNSDGEYFDYASMFSDIYVPSLSELIEACDPTRETFLLGYDDRDGAWKAAINEFIVQEGNIPEEAVASLWLELNKDKQNT